MGANLSVTTEPDLSGVVWSAPDRTANVILLGLWCGVLYAMAMIASTCTLVDRWRGPNDKYATSATSVFGAMLLSIVWPAVMVYVMFVGS